MPIPPTLLGIILAAVDAMAVTDGYHFDYGPANVMRPADRIYPQDFVTAREEEPAGVQMAGKLTQDIVLTFRTLVPKGTGSAMDQAGKVVSDHKRLMGALETTLKASPGFLLVEPVSAVAKLRLSRAVPAEVTLTYRLRYRQDRQNPESA
jgi:hypothetical protein